MHWEDHVFMILSFTSVWMWDQLLETPPENLWVLMYLAEPYSLIVSAVGPDSSYKEPEMGSAHQCTYLIPMNSISVIIEQLGYWLTIHWKCTGYLKIILLNAVFIYSSLSFQIRYLLSFSRQTHQFLLSTTPGSFSLVVCCGNSDFCSQIVPSVSDLQLQRKKATCRQGSPFMLLAGSSLS